MSAAMKFIHLTDTHLVADASDLYGTNPKQRLQQAVAHILAHQPDAQAVTITGDLTHYGHPGAYEHLRECLAPLTMPVFPILGNHDHREIFREYFPHVGRDPEGFVQYGVDFGDHLALFLDTNEPGVHWGVFCERRAAWLREQLEASAKPVLLFMHHPFFPIGIRSMDLISLRDTGPFMAAIAGFEARIRQVFFGHIHRPICGVYHGIGYSTLRGTNHQVALDLHGDESQIIGVHEQPQYGVVLLASDQVLIHTEDYLDCEMRYRLHEMRDEEQS
ncbi:MULTISPECIES: phosphodiesterase [Achromobacter]|uniref:Phosphodiesterase n=2 Tax=Achromobacter TaxID=222 RepID=A0A9X3R3S0_ALCXX|nr:MULTISPECIES: phosphodiesterase [Achromobacter]MCD0500793.1 phosphodiesterase [Achromobacter sp. MY14]MCZ8401359.1 phosphodiesterase [Achromobacter xylosoxidans]MCZ8434789.1 phosphodiesterase [Achromobacter ruhlandii]MDD7979152.1 phosphodiesterase [Achromobacter ruhlandii]MDH0519751.1 phosphodiesterase [Achromobacter xylosoxidans]